MLVFVWWFLWSVDRSQLLRRFLFRSERLVLNATTGDLRHGKTWFEGLEKILSFVSL